MKTLGASMRWVRTEILLISLFGVSSAVAGPDAANPGPAVAGDAHSGATPAKETVGISWTDIVRLVDEHPRLAAGELAIAAARRSVRAAGAAPNPTLEGTLGQGQERPDGRSRLEWGLSLTIPLGWLAQRGDRMDAARAEVDVARAEHVALRREVLANLRALFWNLVHEQDRVASLDSLQAQTEALVRTVRARVDKGESRPVEATRVEVELERVAAELEAAQTSLSARQAELALWLGGRSDKPLVAVASTADLPVALDRDAALTRARATHPALGVARARTRALEASVRAERSARFPDFSVSGFTTHELDRRAYGVGLAVELPVFSWNSGRIAQAEAKLARARKEADASGIEVLSSVLEAQAACHASVVTATRFRNNVVPRSESAATTTEKTYQLGEASLLEVIDARRTLLDSRRLYLDALAQAQIDCSRLRALVGEDR